MTFYHVSHIFNRKSITENGLVPAGGPSPWPEDVYPKGVYLFSSHKEALRYGLGNGDPFDIWKIDIDIKDLLCDPITSGAYYSPSSISTSDISLLESHETDVQNPLH